MGLGVPPVGSSPAEQQRLGLNGDRRLRTSMSEESACATGDREQRLAPRGRQAP
jgi:hypothetical protein